MSIKNMKDINQVNILRDATDTLIKSIIDSGLDGKEQKCIDLLETAIICNECLEFNHIHNLVMVLYLYDIKNTRLNKVLFETNRCLIQEMIDSMSKEIVIKPMVSKFSKDFFD